MEERIDPVAEAWADAQTQLAVRPDLPVVMTRGEVAAFLRVTPETVSTYAHSGRLPYHRVGQELRFARTDVIDYWESLRVVNTQGCGCTGQLPDMPTPPPAP